MACLTTFEDAKASPVIIYVLGHVFPLKNIHIQVFSLLWLAPEEFIHLTSDQWILELNSSMRAIWSPVNFTGAATHLT